MLYKKINKHDTYYLIKGEKEIIIMLPHTSNKKLFTLKYEKDFIQNGFHPANGEERDLIQMIMTKEIDNSEI